MRPQKVTDKEDSESKARVTEAVDRGPFPESTVQLLAPLQDKQEVLTIPA